MQGFNPISSSPISDLGLLEEITGFISVTDNDDTALINAEALAAGYIDTTDDNDTAILVSDNIAAGYIDATDGTDTAQLLGTSSIDGDINATDEDDTAVVYGQVLAGIVGIIDVTDQNDTANLQGDVVSGFDTHDGFTPEERRRAKRIRQKLREKELRLLEEKRKYSEDRKQTIKDLVDPQPKKVKKTKVQSNQEVTADIPSESVERIEQSIARLLQQEQEILQAVALRQELVRVQTELAILEAKRLEELDDETALLLLL